MSHSRIFSPGDGTVSGFNLLNPSILSTYTTETELNDKFEIVEDTKATVVVVDSLPTTDISTNNIYVTPISDDVYIMYMRINNRWVSFGTTSSSDGGGSFDPALYYKRDELDIMFAELNIPDTSSLATKVELALLQNKVDGIYIPDMSTFVTNSTLIEKLNLKADSAVIAELEFRVHELEVKSEEPAVDLTPYVTNIQLASALSSKASVTSVESNTARIIALETKPGMDVSTLVTKTEFNTTIETINTAIETQNTKIDEIESKIPSVSGLVSNEQLLNALSTKADVSVVTNLDSRLTNLESSTANIQYATDETLGGLTYNRVDNNLVLYLGAL